jgi:NTP pyrophosphatase (non-canonical NTP hydrolase)
VSDAPDRVTLPAHADLAALQRYVHELEAMHGWLSADLQRCCFLMGEEVGELFRAVRRLDDAAARHGERPPELVEQLGEEIVDVLNYLLAIANRTGLDLEAAFREKNRRNQHRTWS